MSDDTRRTSRKFAQKAATDADQVEAVAFRDGVARVGDGLTDELIAGAPMAEESEIPHNPNGNAEWLDDDALVEVATGGVADELLRRAELLGPEYPFDLSPDGSHLEYRSERSKSGAYEFCLALCETPHDINKLPHCRAVREFDRFVGRALAGHFGPGTEFYRFGVPGEPEDRRPGKIGDAIRELGRRTRGEWEFTQRLGRDAQADQGDGGIDIVVWKPFGSTDDRIGIPFVLAQCGCGEQALQETKWQDLQLAKFERKYNVRVASASDGVIRYFALHTTSPTRLDGGPRWVQVVLYSTASG